jgi:DNA polymerase sigma
MKSRDLVIERIKTAFYNSGKKNYPHLLDGEITVCATGSCMNGLWSAGSDIDVVIVFHNRMAYNQHQLVRHSGRIIRQIAKNGTLCYVPAIKVPLLKYKDSLTGIDVDLSVNNVLA